MRAIEVAQFGGPEVLVAKDVPDPVPGPGEVVVDVAYADVLWVETRIRSGTAQAYFPTRPPYRPGGSVSGTVRQVGDGVDPGWVGRRVIGRTGEEGGYVSQARIPENGLIALPDAVPLRDGAAVSRDGATAVGLLAVVPVKPGDRVLVTNAGGGLGVLLVQLAGAGGGQVVAAARGAAKLAELRRLGAPVTVDYSAADWTQRVRAAVGAVDVIFDGAGGEYGRAALGLLTDGGWFSAHGTPAGDFATPDPAQAARRRLNVTGIAQVRLSSDQVKRHTEGAVAEIAAGRLSPLIGQVYPLDQAAAAHAAIEARQSTGKTLLSVDPAAD
jgi:NADPH2:quinone reductase